MTPVPIYLDYNASTPIAPAVREAMLPFLAEHYGNPSSGHWAGVPAAQAVARARDQLAALLGCSPARSSHERRQRGEQHWLKGVVEAAGVERPHIVTTAVEHPAIVEPCHYLQRQGVDVTFVGVDATGLVDPADIAAAIRPETALVSVMHANNEVGTIQPIAEIAQITRGRRPAAQRRRAVGGQGPHEGGRPRRRPALGGSAQVLRAEGCRCSLHSRGHQTGAVQCTVPATKADAGPAPRTCSSTSASARQPSSRAI